MESLRDSRLFDEGVKTYFQPFAKKLGLPLRKIEEGVYIIPSQYFDMRIRLDTGHARGLNVILDPTDFEDFEINRPKFFLGIGNIILFHRGNPEDTFIRISTDEQFLEAVRLAAMASERYAEPYLLGIAKDWRAVHEMVANRNKVGQ